ncbi:restriction endonuclease subunit S [Helicobacter pylori]|uniref:restriction endonuclease subunit S n=1 Tax=Helicobacter pylori TaxID=210 RepID=UPI00046CC351|nr:restriction endonuclease subunit S [Helicobacter pylori]
MDALTTPSNWQKVRLGDIAEINPPTIIPNVFYYIDLESVEKGQLLNKQLMTKNKAPSRARRLLSKNDILYQLVRPYQRNNYFFTLNGNYVASTGYAQIRTLQNPSFLYFALLSNYFVNAVLDRCEGTSYPAISSNELKKCEVILPPLNEQIAIANILSDVDRYLYSLDALILKKEGVKKALSFELLSQRKRLKGFNQAWQKVKVKDFGIIITGSTPLTQISEYWNGTISWITPTDINDNKDIFNSERKITQKGLDTIRMIPKNSVLVTCIASIGKNAILRVNGACNQQINAIIPNKDFNADFIYYLMENNKQYLLGKAGVTATYIISKQVFEEIDFFVPKDLNEQAAIANVLSGLDSEIISLKNKKRQFENIKKALNHDLMSAKIRVLKK